jgi:DNA-binding NarL/FixJ family response regulator
VYDLICEGRSNKEIATALVVSEVTVKVHVRNVLRKLGVRTRTEAAILGTRARLLEQAGWSRASRPSDHR